MEYTDLEYFIAIAEHHNLTRAAEALYVSQPTLTNICTSLKKNSVEKSLDEMDTSMILLFWASVIWIMQEEYWHSIRTGKKSFQICALTIMAS